MDCYDDPDFGAEALKAVSRISLELGVNKSQRQYGNLGSVLWIVHGHVCGDESKQCEWVQRRLPKLLRDLEVLTCGWPGHGFPGLRELTQAIHGTDQYRRARAKIENGLLAASAGDYVLVKAMTENAEKFLKRAGASTATADGPKPSQTTLPPAFAKEVKLVYKVLFNHSICTCHMNASPREQVRHLTRLMLPVPETDEKSTLRWEFLFSSRPSSEATEHVSWQDLALHLPPPEKKRVHFGSEACTAISEKKRQHYKPVEKGALCRVLQAETNSRTCLMLQNGKLQQLLAAEPLAQIVDQSPSLSLASILKTYTLAGKMRATLAYILAFSTWQFYESDWLNTPWNSDTIHFLRQPDRKNPHGDPKLYATRPYFAASFDARDPCFSESTFTQGLIHRYPRMRAVGIMLVEIGTGSVIHQSHNGGSWMDTVKRANEDWYAALELVNSEGPWPDCDFSRYRDAARTCLDPETFACVSFSPNDTEQERDAKLERRKKLFYDKVVDPLERLLIGTGWKNEISSMGPLERYRTSTRDEPEPEVAITQEKRPTEKKLAEKWLKRVDALHKEITGTGPCLRGPERVRIAILDTGYDPDAAFFLRREKRIRGWKDWVEAQPSAVDTHGHGTHLLGLIMRIAPEADIFVARVAKTPADLDNVDNVAKAIEWVQRECKADLISTSFGYTEDHLPISKAIRSAINERDESVVFFAAAANSGANAAELFPARHESVISIRGTSSNGYTADFNPPLNPREHCALATLGVEVPSQPLSADAGQRSAVKSGTSIATAITVGIAGLLLNYVNRQSGRPSYYEVKSRLHTRRGMLAMLESISTPSLHREYLYIKPWFLEGLSPDTLWARFEATLLGSG